MKAVTRVKLAIRLMAHVEDLYGLHKLKAQEVPLIHDALLLFIRQVHQESAPHLGSHPARMLLTVSQKIYVFQSRSSAPNRLIVYEDGQPERRLQHVPIFAYEFGLAGLSALDAALAILADFFGETLSLRAFAAGEGHSCFFYQAFAREVLTRPRSQGCFETKHIVTFLRREDRKK